MLKILFIGDIVGKIGRKAIAQIVAKLKKEKRNNLKIKTKTKNKSAVFCRKLENQPFETKQKRS